MMDYIASAQTRGGRERLDQKGETRRDKTERNGVAKYNTRRYAILLRRLETARWSSTFKNTNIVLDSDFIVIVVLLVGSLRRKSQHRKVNSCDETNKLRYNCFKENLLLVL